MFELKSTFEIFGSEEEMSISQKIASPEASSVIVKIFFLSGEICAFFKFEIFKKLFSVIFFGTNRA